MAKRVQTQDLAGPDRLQTFTSIQDVFTRVDRQHVSAPRGAGRNYAQLAEALDVSAGSVVRHQTQISDEQKHEARTQAEAARLKSQLNWAEATEKGIVQPGQNPFFERYYKRLDGEAAAEAAFYKGADLIANGELAHADNPTEVQSALATLAQDHVDGVDDTDYLEGFHTKFARYSDSLVGKQVEDRINAKTLEGQVEFSEDIYRDIGAAVEMYDVDDPETIKRINANLQFKLDEAIKNGMPKTVANQLMVDAVAGLVEEYGPAGVGGLLDGVTGGGPLKNTRAAKATLQRASDNYYANVDKDTDRKFKASERERVLALRKTTASITGEVLALRKITDPIEREEAMQALNQRVLEVGDATAMATLDRLIKNIELDLNKDAVTDNDTLRSLYGDLHQGNLEDFEGRIDRLYNAGEMSIADYENLNADYEEALNDPNAAFGWMKVGDMSQWSSATQSILGSTIGSHTPGIGWIAGPALEQFAGELTPEEVQGLVLTFREQVPLVTSQVMKDVDTSDPKAIADAKEEIREKLAEWINHAGDLSLTSKSEEQLANEKAALPGVVGITSSSNPGATHVIPMDEKMEETITQQVDDRASGILIRDGVPLTGTEVDENLRKTAVARRKTAVGGRPNFRELDRIIQGIHDASVNINTVIDSGATPSAVADAVRRKKDAGYSLNTLHKELPDVLRLVKKDMAELRRMQRDNFDNYKQNLEKVKRLSNAADPSNVHLQSAWSPYKGKMQSRLDFAVRSVRQYEDRQTALSEGYAMLGLPVGAAVDRTNHELGLPRDATVWHHLPVYSTLDDLRSAEADLGDSYSELYKLGTKSGYDMEDADDVETFRAKFWPIQTGLINKKVTLNAK